MAIEIERKFVIEMPDLSTLGSLGTVQTSRIEQTYLLSGRGVTRRVRKRVYPDRTEYYETTKLRIDKMSAVEDERSIDEREYSELLKLADPASVTLNKTRTVVDLGEYKLEIDVYPRWERSCILEVELDSRERELILPPEIKVIREVTGDKAYSNASMSRAFPAELI